MKKLGRKTALMVLVVLVVAAAAVWLMREEPGRILAETVESRGSRLLGTRVDVEDLSVSRDSGAVAASGLSVANPPGFSDADLLNVDSVDARVLFDRRVVEHVTFEGIRALVEFRGASNNFEEVGERVTEDAAGADGDPDRKEDAAGEEAANGGPDDEAADEWLFERVAFRNIQVTVQADWTAETIELAPDDLELRDVEGETDQVARRAVVAFLESVLLSAADRASDERLSESLRERAAELRERLPEAE